MSVKDRLKEFINKYGIAISAFEKSINASNGYVNSISKSIGLDKISNIIEKYPTLNIEWLLTGDGEMLKNDNYVINNSQSTRSQESKIDYDSIIDNAEPISDHTLEVLTNKNGNKFYIQDDNRIKIEVVKIPFPAYASYLEVYNDEVKLQEEFSTITFPVDHIGRGSYIAFGVKGDSMNGGGIDDTPDGADILCREVGRHLWPNGFRRTKYGMVLLTKSGIFHKDIVNFDSTTGEITLQSRNNECKTFQINLNDVYKIFNVIKRYF